MADRPKRIVMFGSAGQNMRHWFEYFETHSQDFQATFICRKFEQFGEKRSNYNHLHIIELSRYWGNPASLLWVLLSRSYDLFILQGIYSPKINTVLFLMLRAKRKFVQIWNASSHRAIAAQPNSLESRLLSWVLRKSDGILFCWESNRDDFVKLFPSLAKKTKVFPGGIGKKYSDLSYAPRHKLTDRLLGDVQPNDCLIFWPRMIQPNNRHDLLVRALPIVRAQLSADLWARVKVVLMGGTSQSIYAESLARSVKKLNMPNVKLNWGKHIEKDYLLRLYDRANIYINLADSDQLTFGVVEAALRRTILILSDIEPYRHLLTLGLEVALVENDPTAIAASLCKAIESVDRGDDDAALEKNRNLVRDVFDEDERFQATLRYCLQ